MQSTYKHSFKTLNSYLRGLQHIYRGGEVDEIRAQVSNNFLEADAVAGTLPGGAGNDRPCGDADNNTPNGEADKDDLYWGAGDDRPFGGSDADTLHGGQGINTLYGEQATEESFEAFVWGDTLCGGYGNDLFSSAAEIDYYYQLKSCSRPYRFARRSNRYPEAVKHVLPAAGAACRQARRGMKNTINSVAACARKQVVIATFNSRKLTCKHSIQALNVKSQSFNPSNSAFSIEQHHA